MAFDGTTHQGMSYLDVQTRLYLNGCLLNFHLMAIPLFEQHAGENIFVVQIKEWPSGESEKDSHLNEIVFKHPNRTSLDE